MLKVEVGRKDPGELAHSVWSLWSGRCGLPPTRPVSSTYPALDRPLSSVHTKFQFSQIQVTSWDPHQSERELCINIRGPNCHKQIYKLDVLKKKIIRKGLFFIFNPHKQNYFSSSSSRDPDPKTDLDPYISLNYR